MLRALFVVVALAGLSSCDGCAPAPVDDEDAGAAGEGEGEGEGDAGLVDDDGGTAPFDAGFVDAGFWDAGFDWTSLLGDAGLQGLECLPGTLPEASLTGLIAALELHTYSGRQEPGVKCGGTTCAPGIPCCVLCGLAKCAESIDGGPAECPALTQTFICDGEEDCPGTQSADTCCYSLSGTDCRAREDCTFELPSLDGGGFFGFLDGGGFNFGDGGFSFGDGGFPFPDAGDGDAGASVDAGASADAGDVDAGDAGAPADAGVVDAGDAGAAVDAGAIADAGASTDAGADLDAGMSLVDAGDVDAGPAFDFESLFAQGLPVCTSSLFFTECDLAGGELCCTSERFVAVDIGICVPALVCLSGIVVP